MSVESFIDAMPKVELHVHLEGAVSREVMLMLADQNEINETLKHFNTWTGLLDKPDYDKLDDLVKVISQWVKQPDDLTRMAYDVGTSLHKQGVRYAEVTVNPALYPEPTMTIEQFMAAVNDGRDRARRAWGIELFWILGVPREEPRRADDYVRFAQTAVARRNFVAGIGLVGRETALPLGQFERPFQTAEKKGVPRALHAGEQQGADGVLKAIQALAPNRITNGWGAWESREVLDLLAQQDIGLVVSPARALRTKKIASYGAIPLRKLYDENVRVVVGSDMPALFKTSLNDLYRALIKDMGFDVAEVQDFGLNAVRASFMPEEQRAAVLEQFRAEYERLAAEHLAGETTKS